MDKELRDLMPTAEEIYADMVKETLAEQCTISATELRLLKLSLKLVSDCDRCASCASTAADTLRLLELIEMQRKTAPLAYTGE